MQEAYKTELAETYGITFNGLLCLNNMPIKRYVDYLQRKGQLEGYMALLLRSFNAAAAEAVMCRATVSVGWDGRIYDCDFNQQLELGLRSGLLPLVPQAEAGHMQCISYHCPSSQMCRVCTCSLAIIAAHCVQCLGGRQRASKTVMFA